MSLYQRGCATLLASWAAYAEGSPGAALLRRPGIAIGVFPAEPERAVYNNALLDRDLSPADRAPALDEMDAAYRAAGIDAYAAWVHESDHGLRSDLERRGYQVTESTRMMGMDLAGIAVPRPEIPIEPASWIDYVTYDDLGSGFLRTADHAALHVLAHRRDGVIVTAAFAYDHDGDCGIFNVGTLESARRQGLATAITAEQLYQARDRGCRTATLQSTPMAEHVYAALGFHDLGRFIEHTRS